MATARGAVTVRRRRRKPAARGATRRQLLDVAGRLFEAKGYRGTSIRDIANSMDTSISNIYHYFGSKEGLWHEIQKQSVRQLPLRLQEAVASESEPARQLRRLLETHLALADEFQRESRIFFLNADQLDQSRNMRQREIQRAVLDVYLEVLGRLARQGRLKSRRVKILAFNILGVLNWMLRWYRPEGELSATEVHKEIIGFVQRGIGLAD
ncbi:MAG: TetR family transcriptional regulator [Steroidobacteraceae bacterium]